MADYAALPIFIDAWALDCAHLSDAEDGRYFRLMRLMWAQPMCRIPNDDVWIARKMGRTPEDVVRDIRPIIEEFCQTTGNWISQKRLRKEYEYVMRRAKKQSDNAKSGWNKRKSDADAYANQMPRDGDWHMSGKAPTPTPTPSYSVPNGTGAPAPPPAGEPDVATIVFTKGLTWLQRQSGKSEGQCRPLLGKWRKEHGDEALIAVLGAAQREGPMDCVGWIEKALRQRAKPASTGGFNL